MSAFTKRTFLAVATAMLSCGMAYAQNIATLVCTPSALSGESQVNLGTTPAATTLKVSYYDVTSTTAANIGSQSSGAGSGKVTFQPFTIHTALSQFGTLATLAGSGTTFSTCVLRTTTKAGSDLEFTFKLVTIVSLDAVGGDADPSDNGTQTAYTSAQLQYGGLQVTTVNAVDNGGTGGTTTGGWNRVNNTTSSGSTSIQ